MQRSPVFLGLRLFSVVTNRASRRPGLWVWGFFGCDELGATHRVRSAADLTSRSALPLSVHGLVHLGGRLVLLLESGDPVNVSEGQADII